MNTEIEWKEMSEGSLDQAGIASPNTTYHIHDNDDGTWLVVVLERRGVGTLNNVVEQNAASEEAAKEVCQKDFAAGKRK